LKIADVTCRSQKDAWPNPFSQNAFEKAICPCPGKRERDLGTDLDMLKRWGAQAIVTLVQESYLP